MHNNAALKFAPVFSNEKRVDMSIENDEAVLQLSTWNDGLGWCVQKTMQLDAELLDEVHRVITAARLKLKYNAGEQNESAKILEFPKFV